MTSECFWLWFIQLSLSSVKNVLFFSPHRLQYAKYLYLEVREMAVVFLFSSIVFSYSVLEGFLLTAGTLWKAVKSLELRCGSVTDLKFSHTLFFHVCHWLWCLMKVLAQLRKHQSSLRFSFNDTIRIVEAQAK